jgi:hypothetical protein
MNHLKLMSETHANEEQILKANNATRICAIDCYIIMALWMGKIPSQPVKTLFAVRPTGCVLVAPQAMNSNYHKSNSKNKITFFLFKTPGKVMLLLKSDVGP